MLRTLTVFTLWICAGTALGATPTHDADGHALPPDVRKIFELGPLVQKLSKDRETVAFPNLTLNALSAQRWTNRRRDGADVLVEDGDNATVLQTPAAAGSEQSYFVGNLSKGSRNIAVVSRVSYPLDGQGGEIKESVTDVVLRKNHHEWLVNCTPGAASAQDTQAGFVTPAGFALFAIVNDNDTRKKLVRQSEDAATKPVCQTYAIPAIRAFLLSNSSGKLQTVKPESLTCAHQLTDCDAI